LKYYRYLVFVCLGFLFLGCREKAMGMAENPLSTADAAAKSDACVDVIFSLSNQDRGARLAMMDILLDDEVVFHGPITHSRNGDYVYVQTHVHRKKVNLEVRSATPAGSLAREKNIWVGDKAWIVIRRFQEPGGGPELDIVVSYEKPGTR